MEGTMLKGIWLNEEDYSVAVWTEEVRPG